MLFFKKKLVLNKYGWKKQQPDHRDFLFPIDTTVKLPSTVNMISQCPPIWDQGQLGSCVSNSVAAAIEFDIKKQKEVDFMPSRLFIYYNGRFVEGTVSQDSGLSVRDGIKVVNTYGVCTEVLFPYNIKNFTKKPSTSCYTQALLHKSVKYQAINQDLTSLQTVLASGYPIVFGASIYTSFESDNVTKTGIVPMPGKNEQLLGGHCLLIVGYINSNKRFIIRNSWGISCGDKGYYYMPYDYILNPNLSSDFWVITTMS